MYTIKGFITSTSFINNEPDTVSNIGEISKLSLSYSTEVGIYSKRDLDTVRLHTFKSEMNGERIAVPELYSDLILEIGSFLYKNSLENFFGDNVQTPAEMLETEFAGAVYDLRVGSMVANNGFWMPEWISFNTKFGTDSVRLWFSDPAFARQYDETEIRIVPPIRELDAFSYSKSSVEPLLNEYTLTDQLNKIDELKDDHPYTKLISSNYTWYQTNDDTKTIGVDWIILVYGNGYENNDLIKSELAKWILDNSEYDIDFWSEVFPGIFRNSEFIITPLWHKFAIPNQTVEAGFNSPIVEYGEVRELIEKFCKGVGYPLDDSLPNTIMSVTPIRTLSFVSTGNIYNTETSTLMNDVLQDYINVSTSSLDFSRMKSFTQEWVRAFVEMLIIADTSTDDFSVPFGFGKVVREGVTYVSKTLYSVTYLVATRKSVLDKLDLDTPYYPDVDLGEDCECSVEDVLVEDHLLDYLNPHRLSTENVELGDVEPFKEFATVTGTLDYMVDDVNDLRRKLLDSSQDNLFNSHMSKINPHGVDHVDVGLSNLGDKSIAVLLDVKQEAIKVTPF